MKKCILILIVNVVIVNFSQGQNVGIGTTKPPSEKLQVNGTIRAERNSDVNSPHLQLHEVEYDYSRLRFSNDGTSKYFSLEGRSALDPSQSKFSLYNSDFGRIFTATAAGRFGINTDIPAATFHVDGVSGFDPIRIQNANATKFRIFSNNAIVLGSNWQTPIANVIRVETPNMFIGFDGDHIPQYRLEVDGIVKMSKLVITQLAQEGRVLTSNAAGIGTWQDPQGDADADPTNEIQTISKSLGTVTLSNGGGSFVDATRDADDNPTNEIQTISKSLGTVTLSGGGGSFEDSTKDADADPTNEIQTISKSFGTVTLSDGGGTFFDEVNDNDADPNNEIQTISKAGNVVSLSNGGGSFTLDNDALEIGDNAYGGIVFWLDESGEHGLVASTANIGGTYEWGTQPTSYYDADGTGIYSGKRNTLLIIEHTSGSSITCAAKACQNYSGGNYGDWYLPSTTEFSILRSAAASLSNLDLTGDYYWTSKEEIDSGVGDVKARTYWGVGTGVSVLQSKTTPNRVRGIRAF